MTNKWEIGTLGVVWCRDLVEFVIYVRVRYSTVGSWNRVEEVSKHQPGYDALQSIMSLMRAEDMKTLGYTAEYFSQEEYSNITGGCHDRQIQEALHRSVTSCDN